MNLHLFRTQVYITSVIIIQTHGYVLLAANLQDFKSIAKKFVPEDLANQLTDLASHSPIKYREADESDDSQEDSTSTSEYNAKRKERDDPIDDKETPKDVQLLRINFEELVQKVKERIEKDLVESQKKIKAAPKERDKLVSYSKKRPARVSHFANDRWKKTTKTLIEPNLDRQVKEPAQDDNMPFAKIEMKDSYDDYVTPAKEEDVFESDVEKLDDIPTTPAQMPDYTDQETESPIEEAYDDKTEELKAKTEDLWYDYKVTNATEDYTDTTPMKSKNQIRSTKKSMGTMIPKRDFYKISSPNYFAKVPIVAEKYDFTEPLPEKDRQPENLKYFKGLPPVIINGKVKLSK